MTTAETYAERSRRTVSPVAASHGADSLCGAFSVERGGEPLAVGIPFFFFSAVFCAGRAGPSARTTPTHHTYAIGAHLPQHWSFRRGVWVVPGRPGQTIVRGERLAGQTWWPIPPLTGVMGNIAMYVMEVCLFFHFHRDCSAVRVDSAERVFPPGEVKNLNGSGVGVCLTRHFFIWQWRGMDCVDFVSRQNRCLAAEVQWYS